VLGKSRKKNAPCKVGAESQSRKGKTDLRGAVFDRAAEKKREKQGPCCSSDGAIAKLSFERVRKRAWYILEA